jgi:uncharacterized Rmd1/YagE family protein
LLYSDLTSRVGFTAYFDAVSSEFEMEDRIETINQKIDYASEVQSTLRALLTEVSRDQIAPISSQR